MLDRKGQKAIPERKAPRETPAQLERLGLRGLREILALRDRRVSKDRLA